MTRRGMRYFLLFISLIWLSGVGYGQVTLPIDFEGDVTVADFTFFDGAVVSIVSNPFSGGINTSGTVGELIKNSGGVFAGTYILPDNLDFTANPIIRMKVYTEAPVDTRITLKTELCPGCAANSQDIHAFTTVSEAWEVLSFDFTGQPVNPRLVFFFNSFNMGDGSGASTFYFDDIVQPPLLDGNELALPIDFEGLDFADNPIDSDNLGPIDLGHLGANGFLGGAATVIDNPNQTPPDGLNPSAKVAQIIRHSGTEAGASIDLPEDLVLDLDPIICMNVFTEADEGTPIILRIEDSRNSSIFMQDTALTTVSGGWDTLCFVFHNAPPTCDRLTFYFDRGNTGDGSASSTFLFDDIYQPLTPSSSTIFFTPGSQFFCPPAAFELSYPGTGPYEWFDNALGTGTPIGTNPTYPTGTLNGTTSFWVRDMAISATINTPVPVGPSFGGQTDPVFPTASVFFTSYIDNGFFHGVDIFQKNINVPGDCEYTVSAENLTQNTLPVATDTLGFPNNVDNIRRTFTFDPALPMDLNDNIRLSITVSGGCAISAHLSGPEIITSFPEATSGGELLFTSNTLPAGRWTGFNYRVSGEVIANPILQQVNAIADCASPLPIQLIDFSVRDDNGDALLIWSTASELNNDRFLLLRTVDGIEYETAGIVSGAGNSSTVINYSFRDRNPEKGLSYYKLRQVDFDGTKTDSEPVAYTNDTSGEFRLFPNPTHRNLTLSTALPYEQVDVIIYDLSGRVINRLNYGAIENQDFELEGHPGTYFVEILVDGERKAIFNVLKL